MDADVSDDNGYDDDDNNGDLEETRFEADYGPRLPKHFYYISSKDIDEATYDQSINIRGDGFRGLRVLA